VLLLLLAMPMMTIIVTAALHHVWLQQVSHIHNPPQMPA
jgi:hypothetical protein